MVTKKTKEEGEENFWITGSVGFADWPIDGEDRKNDDGVLIVVGRGLPLVGRIGQWLRTESALSMTTRSGCK